MQLVRYFHSCALAHRTQLTSSVLLLYLNEVLSLSLCACYLLQLSCAQETSLIGIVLLLFLLEVLTSSLCACCSYPVHILGLSPSWYKSRAYRARSVRDPRAVLREFGTAVPDHVRIVVRDSTADTRFQPSAGWKTRTLHGLQKHVQRVAPRLLAMQTTECWSLCALGELH